MKKLLLLFYAALLGLVGLSQPTTTIGHLRSNNNSDTTREKYDLNPVKIYPNPAENDITVDLGNINKGQLKMYTINGSEILRQEVISNEKINISQLRDGFYFYEIISNGKLIQVGRIIKKQ